MKILLYSANFTPEPTGIGKYSGEMASWLVRRGHQVRVIAAPPYYPSYRPDPAYRWPPYRSERIDGATVLRAPLWVPRNPGGASRALHLASFAASSLPLALAAAAWRPDVVLTVAPFLTCAPAGWLSARLSGARCWLHIQDFEVDAAFELGLLKGKALRRVVLWFERHLLRRFDAVSSISKRMVDRLLAKGVAFERAIHFPNWVDVESVRPLGRPSNYRQELGIGPDTVVALFSGTLGAKQGLSIIPQAAALLADRSDILFMICGDGVVKPQLERDCAALSNVRLLPLQPAERLCELLNLADIHLLTQGAGAEDLVLPSKLTGMLASGRPVIATCREGTEISTVLEFCGQTVEPGDATALAGAVAALADDAGRRRRLGEAARTYAENQLSRDAVLEQLEQELKSAVAGPSLGDFDSDDAEFPPALPDGRPNGRGTRG